MRTTVTVRRRGYSLTVVLLFLVLLLGLWAAVYRTTASFLRVETARVKRDDLDSGMLSALGQALMYLEHPERYPPPPRTQVTYYGVKVSPGDPSGQNFTVTFNPVTASASQWTITVAPGLYPTPLPGS
jgi:hypothetical protein